MSESDPQSGPLQQAGERARAGLEEVQRKGRDVIIATREKGEALLDDTREKSQRAAAEANRLFQEHPLTALAVAATAGAVIGIFLPRLALGSRASALAGRAVKAAVASEAPHKLWSSIRAAGRREPEQPAQAAPEAPTGSPEN